MHSRDARAQGEAQRRLDILSAWREAPAEEEFTDEELVWVLMAISVIDVWNRMAITIHQDLPANPR